MILLELCDTSHWQKEDIFRQIVINDNMIILKATQEMSR